MVNSYRGALKQNGTINSSNRTFKSEFLIEIEKNWKEIEMVFS